MPHLHKKIKKGRPYYYIREIRRVNGKPTVVSQVYLGTVEKILQLRQEADAAGKPAKLQVREFGSLWVAHQLERELNTIGAVDAVVPPDKRETGPSVGEYFFFAWANRMAEPCSKNALEAFYRRTAVQGIRPVDIGELTSERYWDKWNRVSETAAEEIARRFFRRVAALYAGRPEGVLFDTTNNYTFMASKTKSELARRGKNKEGRDNLRQIGVALLVDRDTALPLYCKAFPGNMHDSKVFAQTADEMMAVLGELNPAKLRMTVVFDKGVNSLDNIRYIDDKPHVHFITTYSNHFAPDIAGADLKNFAPLDIEKNRRLEERGKAKDKILAWRTRAPFWGKERTVVVTYNPATARKQRYTLDQKLETLRETLLEFRANFRASQPHWRDPDAIRDRYIRACEELYIGSQYYHIEFTAGEMSFRKDLYQVARSQSFFGKNIIITDNHDWSNKSIVQLSLDRYLIEHSFRSGKSRHHVQMRPVHHWTDSKLRCHILTCAMTLTAMKILEIKAAAAGLKMTAPAIMQEMRALHSVLVWQKGKKQPHWMIEEPSETQQLVLKAFGHFVNADGVLQPLP